MDLIKYHLKVRRERLVMDPTDPKIYNITSGLAGSLVPGDFSQKMVKIQI